MAGLGGKNWAFEEEVTSSDVNGYLADQVVMRFADSATRTAGFGGSGEPTLAEGMVSYLDDTNRLAYYNGSSWVDVPVVGDFGLQLIKAQTIGTAVSSVTVSDAFSADFDNYKITVSGGAGSTAAVIQMTLGSTTSAYYWTRVAITYGNAGDNSTGNNTSSWQVGFAQTTTLSTNIDVFSPFLSDETWFNGPAVNNNTAGGAGSLTGFLNNTTSYTAFTLAPSSGTMTGGTIRVYGYRNS